MQKTNPQQFMYNKEINSIHKEKKQKRRRNIYKQWGLRYIIKIKIVHLFLSA
jgi:hypothetical protein